MDGLWMPTRVLIWSPLTISIIYEEKFVSGEIWSEFDMEILLKILQLGNIWASMSEKWRNILMDSD